MKPLISKCSMIPAWHQLVPISGHVEESETARKLQLYATSIKTSVSTRLQSFLSTSFPQHFLEKGACTCWSLHIYGYKISTLDLLSNRLILSVPVSKHLCLSFVCVQTADWIDGMAHIQHLQINVTLDISCPLWLKPYGNTRRYMIILVTWLPDSVGLVW